MRRKTEEATLDPEQASVVIQSLARGFIGRRRCKRKRTLRHREKYQRQFESVEALHQFKFESYGAVLIIQRWFRSWVFLNKQRWHKKYWRFIQKLKGQKLLFRAIQKSGLRNFVEADLDVRANCRTASAIVIERIVRSYVGRHRFIRVRLQRERFERQKDGAATKIQAFFRRCLVHLHWPTLGYRYRMLMKKRKTYLTGRVLGCELPLEEGFPPAEVTLGHRISVLYPHLRLAPLEDFPQLDYHATQIQSLARIILARAVYRRRMQARYERSVQRIQKWWLGLGWRRKMKMSIRKIQPIWKRNFKIKVKTRAAALKIQTWYRCCYQMRKYHRYKLQKRYSYLRVIRWFIYRTCVRRVHAAASLYRVRREIHQAGEQLFQATKLFWLCHFTWLGVKKTQRAETGQHELQRIFMANALNNGLELTRIIKILKEGGNLLDNDFSPNTVELQFTKIKAPNEKRVDYTKFVDLLANLAAVKFLKIDPVKGSWEEIAANEKENKTSAKRGNSATMHAPAVISTPVKTNNRKTVLVASGATQSAVHETPLQQQANFQYGGLRGKAAFVTKFVLLYFRHLPDYQKAVNYLDSKAASSLADARVLDSARAIVTFMHNRTAVRRITQSLRALKEGKIRTRQYAAITRIQALIRRFLAQRRVTRLAQTLYSKFVDGESEADYWFNPRTQRSHWTKPSLLGALDCGLAVRMPKPEEMFTISCSVCEKVTATCYCQQCDAPMCTGCFAKNHRAGQRKTHEHLLIDNCVQCDFQIGTRYCQTCKDIFCDSCFRYMHKKGRLRFHACLRYCPVCDNCEERSAQWKEMNTMGLVSVKNWCTVCYREQFQSEPVVKKASSQENGFEKIKFYGKQVAAFQVIREKEKKAKEIDDLYKKRQEELYRQKVIKAVVTVQRCWRGFCGRRRSAAFVQARREMMLVRQDEDKVRTSWWYRLQMFLGLPPKLLSDTPLERVKKLYPWYMHQIVAECIENQWTEACQLLVEHEERLARAPKSNILQRLGVRWQILWTQRHYEQLQRRALEVATLVDAAATSYYNVCAHLVTPPLLYTSTLQA